MTDDDLRRVSIEDLARRCLKPDPERRGTWTARRWGRPAALRVTKIVAPQGATAHQATLAACAVAFVGIVGFGFGTPTGWTCGALALHAWYVLDHVDGQLARLRRTASLDGTWLDYLMHHSVNMLLPLAVGFGLQRQTGSDWWTLVGVAWAWGALMIGLRHDAKYKAFVRRWKSLEGELTLIGGGGGRPQPAFRPAAKLKSIAAWCVLKIYETHVAIGLLTLLAAARLPLGTLGDLITQWAVLVVAVPAPLVAVTLIARDVRRDEAEREFSAWFRVHCDSSLSFDGDAWVVTQAESTDDDSSSDPSVLTCRHGNT